MSKIIIDTLLRSKRKTISLHITRDAKIVVKAPLLTPLAYINRFIEEKSTWISQRLALLEQTHATSVKKYIEGEKFLYLGKEYMFHSGNYSEISLADAYLLFPQVLLFRAQKELTNWYVKQAKEKITQRVAYRAKEMHAAYKAISFSDTKAQWGSCSPDNALQFSWRLIMTPLPVLDYVVIHELTHTQEKNHSLDFWSKVRLYTPAYRQHRKWLNSNVNKLII